MFRSPVCQRSLRWKAAASLLATAALLGIGTTFWKTDVPKFSPAPALSVASPLVLREPVVELDGRSGCVGTVVLRAAVHLAGKPDFSPLIERLRRQGVRRVWLQCKQDETDEFVGGEVFYPSALAPVAAGFDDGRLWCFVDAIRAAGIEVAAWLPAFHDPRAATLHPEWRAYHLRPDGVPMPQDDWLCPRNADAVAYEASLLREVCEKGAGRFAAIYTDFIRYDADSSCACARCLSALGERLGGAKVDRRKLLAAAKKGSPLWAAWTEMRGAAIRDALDTMRDAIAEVAPGLWFGACVLPFSAEDYSLNTQSGQDLGEMCQAGVDEIVLMGYWDDWEKSPEWLAKSIIAGRKQVDGDAKFSVLLDADMSLRSTLATLAAIGADREDAVWFNYRQWDDQTFTTLHHAQQLCAKYGGVPRAEFTAVTIRIDTEPDSRRRYDTVTPEMIGRMLDLFSEEGVKASFITCGRIAELQRPVLARAVAEGHEVGSHGYNHEQLDELPDAEQVAVVDRSIAAMQEQGFVIEGFGAPRNSITDIARERLIHHGLLYDGSAAYDPLVSYCGPEIVRAANDPTRGIMVMPFIFPNDWDARFVAGLSAPEMAAAWIRGLDKMAAAGEPCFIINTHQWISSLSDNLAALRTFIRAAKARPDCRILTLRDTARHTLTGMLRIESEFQPKLTAKEDR
ncbi:MAG: polysaccharide deacetylase family protein [Chthoniobacter sp.]|nr:polysaccharide deacetylase family protein [Chthoniobacter sp.]